MTHPNDEADEPIVLNAGPQDLSDEARALAEWYASDEFARQLLAVFEKARQAAIASNPPNLPG